MREGKKTAATDLEAMLQTMKAAPVRAGEQLHGNHLVFNGTNRKQRRAIEAKTAPKALSPQSGRSQRSMVRQRTAWSTT